MVFSAPKSSKGVQVSCDGTLPSAAVHIYLALRRIGVVTESRLLVFSLSSTSFGLAGDSQTTAEISRP